MGELESSQTVTQRPLCTQRWDENAKKKEKGGRDALTEVKSTLQLSRHPQPP